MPPGDHGGGMSVRPGALEQHAAALDSIADSLSTAHHAGQSVRLDAGAYGQLCSFVPVLLDGLQRGLVDGMSAAVHSFRDTGTRLREVASGYTDADKASAAGYESLGRR